MKIAVVIPCYKVGNHIGSVIKKIPDTVHKIYCVNDACPEDTAKKISTIKDSRVFLISHDTNQGVGGAVVTGYQQAIEDSMDIVVKIDGDGQMDPSLIPVFIDPIIKGDADYTKGNRFYRMDDVRTMPNIRLFGNAILSFITKLSSGYWTLFDPTNGYTAIHTSVLKELPLKKLAKRYFFESDLLFRLNTIRATIHDIPMRAIYGKEQSNLNISKILIPFIAGHSKNFFKRIFYNYFLRDFNIASIELFFGLPLMIFGIIFSINKWSQSIAENITSSAGTVMVGALPIIIGMQFILSFIHYDIRSVPNKPIHTKLMK